MKTDSSHLFYDPEYPVTEDMLRAAREAFTFADIQDDVDLVSIYRVMAMCAPRVDEGAS